MLLHLIREGDTPEALSAKYRVPVCAILRANRIHSAAWLLPGREIKIPDADFCRRDGFICPAIGVNIKAEEARLCVRVRMRQGDTAISVAARHHLPVRLVCLAAGRADGRIPEGAEFLLPVFEGKSELYIVQPMDSVRSLADKWGCAEGEIRRRNCLWGPILPGMQILFSER